MLIITLSLTFLFLFLFLFLLGTIQAPVDYFKKPIACNVD